MQISMFILKISYNFCYCFFGISLAPVMWVHGLEQYRVVGYVHENEPFPNLSMRWWSWNVAVPSMEISNFTSWATSQSTFSPDSKVALVVMENFTFCPHLSSPSAIVWLCSRPVRICLLYTMYCEGLLSNGFSEQTVNHANDTAK